MRGPSKENQAAAVKASCDGEEKSTCEGGVGAGGWRFQKSSRPGGAGCGGIRHSGPNQRFRPLGLAPRPREMCHPPGAAGWRGRAGSPGERQTGDSGPLPWVRDQQGAVLLEADLGGGVNPCSCCCEVVLGVRVRKC